MKKLLFCLTLIIYGVIIALIARDKDTEQGFYFLQLLNSATTFIALAALFLAWWAWKRNK